MSRLGQTPSQTVGPFFHMRLGEPAPSLLVPPGTRGAIRIEGRVLDGGGDPVDDALVELWQADAEGRYCHPRDRWPPARGGFTGFGRSATSAEGAYVFDTLKPGRVRSGAGAGDGKRALQAPHVSLIVLARGLLAHLYTRVYFEDEAAANAEDPVLAQVPPARLRTLIAVRAPGSAAIYRHDVVLQGADETVFFDV
jgi:protocatechuate 3,4-dioxygenase alpha subunit